MENILLSYLNLADSATFASITGSDANYPVSNLGDDNISKPWRSNTSTGGKKAFRFSRTAASACAAAAIANHNLTQTAQVRFRMGLSPFDVDFAAGVQTDDRITYSGGTNGTLVNGSGLVAAATSPRLDHDPATLGCRGLRIEEARTNICLWSRDGSNAAWVKSNITAAKTATGADGAVNSATTITATAGNGTILQTIVSASAQRAVTAWVKRRTGAGNIQMTLDNGATWTTIAVTSAWSRVFIPTQLFTNPVVGFRIVTSGDAIDFDYVQCETGFVPTSQIATTSASVTRSIENVATLAANFTSWFNSATEGTLYVEYAAEFGNTSATNATALDLSDGTTSNRVTINTRASDGLILGTVVVGGVNQAVMVSSAMTYGTPAKVAVAFKANDFAICVNGGALTTDAAGSVPSVSQLNIGSLGTGGQVLNGHVKRVAFWPTRLTNTQLQTLTTSGPGGIDYDSGFINAVQMTYNGPLSDDWGSVYDVIHYFGDRSVRYGVVEVLDTANTSNYAQIGRFFAGSVTFQPEDNAEYGKTDGWIDPSVITRTQTRKKLSIVVQRVREVAFNFPFLTIAEGDALHDMLGIVGMTEEVLFIPDPSDSAATQRYGFLGTLEKLDPLRHPYLASKSHAFQIEQKK
jgi:hypothetical protein